MPHLQISATADGECTGDSAFSATNFPAADGDTGIDAWFSFPSVAIDQGQTIQQAYLVLTAESDQTGGTLAVRIYGIDEDDHVAPTNVSEWDTDHSTHTTAFTNWSFSTEGTQGVEQTTPDITDVIQEIVDRPSWANGNSIGIHIDENSALNQRQTWQEEETGTAAVLHIITAGFPLGILPIGG